MNLVTAVECGEFGHQLRAEGDNATPADTLDCGADAHDVQHTAMVLARSLGWSAYETFRVEIVELDGTIVESFEIEPAEYQDYLRSYPE